MLLFFNFAVGNGNKNRPFYANKINSGGRKIKPVVTDKIYTYDNSDIIEVEMIELDSFIEQYELQQPNTIIMDIEGYEFFALRNAQTALKNSRKLYIEFVLHHLNKVAKTSLDNFLELILPLDQ